MIRSYACLILCPIALLSSSMTLAQEQTGPARPSASEVVCLERAFPDIEQVPDAQRGRAHVVRTTVRGAQSLQKKGFRPVSCAAGGMASRTGGASDAGLAAWRDEMCELASLGNVAVQNQLERALGERPAVLCAYGEELSGPWDRRQAPKIKTER